jgi:hypothetical protein
MFSPCEKEILASSNSIWLQFSQEPFISSISIAACRGEEYVVTPASDLKDSIEKKVEEEVDSLDSSIDSEIKSAADSDSWPVKYDMSSYNNDVRSRTESRVSSAGYSTEWDDDYLVIRKP